jgi:Lon protease-like protein
VPTVPLFPLRTVLVPGLVLPLHIFEPRYRLMVRMIADAPEDERGFGIVAQVERS